MNTEFSQDNNTTAILKELSDIKSNLAINSTETINIKQNITEIKADIREIKNDSVSRQELSIRLDAMKIPTLQNDVEVLKEFRWRLVGISSIVASAITFIGQLVIKYLST